MLHVADPEHSASSLLRNDPPHRPDGRREVVWTWIIALSLSLSYSLTYFWRYPVFVLPATTLERRVLGRLDLQACFSLAFIVGFGIAKFPAAAVASSSFFFRHRLKVLLALLTVSMCIEGFGLLATNVPVVQILAVFCSSFLSSWIYGMELTCTQPSGLESHAAWSVTSVRAAKPGRAAHRAADPVYAMRSLLPSAAQTSRAVGRPRVCSL